MTSLNMNVTTAAVPVRPPGRCDHLLSSTPVLAAQWIRENRFYIQIPIALIGAIMVFLVYARKITKGSPYLYMCVLTLADTSYIIMDTLFHKLPYRVAGVDWGDVGCGMLEYTFHITQMFAVGVLVFMMFERMLLTMLPVQKHFFSVKKTAITLAILFVSVSIINIQYAYSKHSVKVRLTPGGAVYHYCHYQKQYQQDLIPVIFIKMVGSFFLAMAILLFCSVTVAIKICLMRKRRDVDNTNKNVDSKTDDVENNLEARGNDRADDLLRDMTTQVMVVSICFVVLAFPYGIAFLPGGPLGPKPNVVKTCDESAFAYVFKEVSKLLYDMQHCLNAYLYCLSSRVFRRALAEKLGLRKPSRGESYTMTETIATELTSNGVQKY